MRFALGSLVVATLTFLGAATGAFDTWTLPVSAVALLVTAVVAAVAMEARDLDSVEALVAHGTASRRDVPVDDTTLEAA
jgi:hypothetical protein